MQYLLLNFWIMQENWLIVNSNNSSTNDRSSWDALQNLYYSDDLCYHVYVQVQKVCLCVQYASSMWKKHECVCCAETACKKIILLLVHNYTVCSNCHICIRYVYIRTFLNPLTAACFFFCATSMALSNYNRKKTSYSTIAVNNQRCTVLYTAHQQPKG